MSVLGQETLLGANVLATNPLASAHRKLTVDQNQSVWSAEKVPHQCHANILYSTCQWTVSRVSPNLLHLVSWAQQRDAYCFFFINRITQTQICSWNLRLSTLPLQCKPLFQWALSRLSLNGHLMSAVTGLTYYKLYVQAGSHTLKLERTPPRL